MEDKVHRWLYHGIIHYLVNTQYSDRYRVVMHEIPSISERSVTSVGPRAYKAGSLITVNKYEFMAER